MSTVLGRLIQRSREPLSSLEPLIPSRFDPGAEGFAAGGGLPPDGGLAGDLDAEPGDGGIEADAAEALTRPGDGPSAGRRAAGYGPAANADLTPSGRPSARAGSPSAANAGAPTWAHADARSETGADDVARPRPGTGLLSRAASSADAADGRSGSGGDRPGGSRPPGTPADQPLPGLARLTGRSLLPGRTALPTAELPADEALSPLLADAAAEPPLAAREHGRGDRAAQERPDPTRIALPASPVGPAITITIGHLEIAAAPAPRERPKAPSTEARQVQPAAPTRPPFRPRVSLSDFLNQRADGHR